MTFEQALEEIFRTVIQCVRESLDAFDNDKTPDYSGLTCLQVPVGPKQEQLLPVDFYLDENGNFYTEKHKAGIGKTIDCVAWITDPDANYTINVQSSAGGGGTWNNVKVNERLRFKIKTHLFGKTKVSVAGHATVNNKNGHAMIDYKVV